jgi:DNA-binding transcriptional regulator GbsR (MarR family)
VDASDRRLINPGAIEHQRQPLGSPGKPPQSQYVASSFSAYFPSAAFDIFVMTEIAEATEKLPDAAERFVLHWGDMGGQWGVNRSISQIHALLYLSERPRTAEEIAAVLGLARSNVSTSIRQLMAWNLIRRVPVKGDRREHFEAEADVWEIAMRIAAIRKEREIDPAVETLKACVTDAERDPKLHPVVRKRLTDMLSFVETLDRWYMQMLTVPKPQLAALIRLGTRIVSLMPLSKRK